MPAVMLLGDSDEKIYFCYNAYYNGVVTLFLRKGDDANLC